MKRTALADHPCSIARTLDVAGEWWSPLILRDVTYGVRRFGEIQADLGISANVLADRLESLVREGLLETRVYQQRPERHECVGTEKGADLVPGAHCPDAVGRPLDVERWGWARCRSCTRTAVTRVRVELRCEHCERDLAFLAPSARVPAAG